MKSFKTALIYGFITWLIPFAVAFWIFPLRESQRALFESIIPVVISISVVIFAIIYLKKLEKKYLREGLILGFLWLAVSMVIDLFMFMWGPMKMSISDYMEDVGLTYLMIPVITTGLAYLLKTAKINKLELNNEK
ncbi:hypothetical protein KKC44_06685 [Patescibacteria group bacterium]|nr:hypothetical protein [Patescibacteria group bacterium]MBU2260257.1 hypothetical protein [Patescibacteria group bacterium]